MISPKLKQFFSRLLLTVLIMISAAASFWINPIRVSASVGQPPEIEIQPFHFEIPEDKKPSR